jgi:hypothetical protein
LRPVLSFRDRTPSALTAEHNKKYENKIKI